MRAYVIKIMVFIFCTICTEYKYLLKVLFIIIFNLFTFNQLFSRSKLSIGIGYPQTLTYFDEFNLKTKRGIPTLDLTLHFKKKAIRIQTLYVFNYAYANIKQPITFPDNFTYLKETYQVALTFEHKLIDVLKAECTINNGIATKASVDKTHLYYVNTWNESIQKTESDFLALGITSGLNIKFNLNKRFCLFSNIIISKYFINTNHQTSNLIISNGIIYNF